MAFTLGNAKQFLQDRNRDDQSARATRVHIKIANDANIELRRTGKYDFDKRYTQLLFQGLYNTGTVSISPGGTTLTGVGTTWTSSMVGRFMRYNGEDLQYRVTAFGSTTSLTVEAYRGTSPLSAVTYELTDDRVALPARFRDFAWPATNYRPLPRLAPLTLEMMKLYRKLYRIVSFPYTYSYEWVDVGSPAVPTPYMWIWPSTQDLRVVDVPYYQWPIELSNDSDVFGIPAEGESALREFMLAFLYREQGKPDATQQFALAKGMAEQHLAASRTVAEDDSKRPWYPDADPMDGRSNYPWPTLAPGEPKYG